MQFQDAVTAIYNNLIERNFTPYEAHSICRLIKNEDCHSMLKSMAAVSSKELKVKDAIEKVRSVKEKYVSAIENLVDILLASVKAKDAKYFVAPIMSELTSKPTYLNVIRSIMQQEDSPVELNDIVTLRNLLEDAGFTKEAVLVHNLCVSEEKEQACHF